MSAVLGRIAGALLALSALPAGAAPATLPPPTGLSPQAVAALKANDDRPKPASDSMEARRAWSEAVQQEIGQPRLKRFGVAMEERTIAGVPVRVFTSVRTREEGPLLVDLPGGGFVVDAGSITENAAIAGLTGYRIVSVRYRLSPEHAYPAALDDAYAVWRALRAQSPHARMGLYGTSAGAILSGQLVARLKARGEPLPAALGFFSGSADLQDAGDSMTLFGDPAGARQLVRGYLGPHEANDPLVSAARGDLTGWPATLCLSSSRDILLSPTAAFCHRLRGAGVASELVVYDGLPHAFWAYIDAPETDAAFADMAGFFRRALETPR